MHHSNLMQAYYSWETKNPQQMDRHHCVHSPYSTCPLKCSQAVGDADVPPEFHKWAHPPFPTKTVYNVLTHNLSWKSYLSFSITGNRKLVMAMLIFQKEKLRHKENLWGTPELVNYISLLVVSGEPLFTEISLKITREKAGSRSKQKRVVLNNCNHSALSKLRTWLESYIRNLCHHFTSKPTHKTHDQNNVTSGELSLGKVVVTTEGLVSLPFATRRGQSHFPTGLI